MIVSTGHGVRDTGGSYRALEETAGLGLDGLELTFGSGEFAPGISEAKCRAIRARAQCLKLRIETLATGYYWGHPLSAPDAVVRREAIEFTKEYLRAAAGCLATESLRAGGIPRDVPELSPDLRAYFNADMA